MCIPRKTVLTIGHTWEQAHKLTGLQRCQHKLGVRHPCVFKEASPRDAQQCSASISTACEIVGARIFALREGKGTTDASAASHLPPISCCASIHIQDLSFGEAAATGTPHPAYYMWTTQYLPPSSGTVPQTALALHPVAKRILPVRKPTALLYIPPLGAIRDKSKFSKGAAASSFFSLFYCILYKFLHALSSMYLRTYKCIMSLK